MRKLSEQTIRRRAAIAAAEQAAAEAVNMSRAERAERAAEAAALYDPAHAARYAAQTKQAVALYDTMSAAYAEQAAAADTYAPFIRAAYTTLKLAAQKAKGSNGGMLDKLLDAMPRTCRALLNPAAAIAADGMSDAADLIQAAALAAVEQIPAAAAAADFCRLSLASWIPLCPISFTALGKSR